MGRHRRADGTGRGGRVRKLAEAHYHTPEEVRDYLAQLAEIAQEAKLAPHEFEVLAPTILNLLAAKQVLYEQPQASPLMLDGLHNLR